VNRWWNDGDGTKVWGRRRRRRINTRPTINASLFSLLVFACNTRIFFNSQNSPNYFSIPLVWGLLSNDGDDLELLKIESFFFKKKSSRRITRTGIDGRRRRKKTWFFVSFSFPIHWRGTAGQSCKRKRSLCWTAVLMLLMSVWLALLRRRRAFVPSCRPATLALYSLLHPSNSKRINKNEFMNNSQECLKLFSLF
jgi:hypothetical protein